MSVSALLKKIVMLTGDLPTIPHTAQTVLQKLSDPETTSKEIETVIIRDPSLTARILKLANSPFYGRARLIKTISEATVLIGFNILKSLVVASAVREFFKVFGLIEQLLWQHSVAVAFIARLIATKKSLKNTEEVFLSGLLHDIGKIVLQLKVPDRMTMVIEDLYNGMEQDSIIVESKVFGFTHAHVGQLVVRKWQSQEIEEAIGYHHWPGRSRLNPSMCYVVHLANCIAHKMEIGPIRTPDLDPSEQISAEMLGFLPGEMEVVLEECREKLQAEVGDIFS